MIRHRLSGTGLLVPRPDTRRQQAVGWRRLAGETAQCAVRRLRPCASRARPARATDQNNQRQTAGMVSNAGRPATHKRRLCAVDGSAPHITPASAGQLPQPWGTLFQLVLLNATVDPVEC